MLLEHIEDTVIAAWHTVVAFSHELYAQCICGTLAYEPKVIPNEPTPRTVTVEGQLTFGK
jgi:hypothetical protein